MADSPVNDFKLEFSNRVIEHLGIRLYQNKPTNVAAEFVSNSWDGDAREVKINLSGSPISLTITDNGRGMTRDELINEFLVIGRNRRSEPSEKTKGGRLPMGRKGIGKLAGFGIAHTVDVLSVPNPKHRTDIDVAGRTLCWLRFKLDGILLASQPIGESGYHPEVIADNVAVDELDSLIQSQKLEVTLKDFKDFVAAGEGGVCIHLHDTTLKKSINIDQLLSSLGHRFTVTMLRPDFTVKVNDKPVNPKSALPTFLEYRVGSIETLLKDTIKINGVDREVRFWAGFVSLKDAEWPIENAGVGVYAHGKIAQDRPFFFGVKGKEIFSRYIYGVVEADWLDELPDDVVSTDRRSINWDDDATNLLYKWGADKLALWLDGFKTWKKNQPREEIKKRIRDLPAAKRLTGTEEDALSELLGEVFVTLGNDDEAKTHAISSITSAWTHEPTRKLTQTLWQEVLGLRDSDQKKFVDLIDKLKESMVPEAMGLAVTMAQRIAAITTMRKLVDEGKRETDLQRLIEQFPWLLGPEWEKLTANQSVKTLVTKKHKPDIDLGEWSITEDASNLRPDFVFLSDVGEQREIVVFELKGAEHEKTLQVSEYQQLNKYLNIIRGAYPDREKIKVSGVLVGHDKGGFEESDTRIKVITWATVLASARAMHVSYLASLLRVYEPAANDARLQQISDFGGKETMELLEKLGALEPFPEVIINGLKT